MFTLNDIEMLEVPKGTNVIIIRERNPTELDQETKQIITKQFKKALKLPVVFMPYGTDIDFS